MSRHSVQSDRKCRARTRKSAHLCECRTVNMTINVSPSQYYTLLPSQYYTVLYSISFRKYWHYLCYSIWCPARMPEERKKRQGKPKKMLTDSAKCDRIGSWVGQFRPEGEQSWKTRSASSRSRFRNRILSLERKSKSLSSIRFARILTKLVRFSATRNGTSFQW